MRIALVSPLFESVPPRFYGGTERVVSNLCRGLTEAGHEVTVFASGDSLVEGRLIPVVDQSLRLRDRPAADPHAYTLRMLSVVAERADEFDVIHNHHDYWMLPLSKMTDTPLVTTLHGRLDIPDVPAAYFAYPDCHFVSISDHQRGPLALLPWVRTVRHGIDLDHLRFKEGPGKYLAFLGRMDGHKRPDWAIEIARKSGIPLKIAAKIEGPEGQSFWEERVRPHVDGRFIEYLGEIGEHEKADFLGDALGLAFPIDWPEPFGLVMVEALACGTPVLARPRGSVPELLRDGVTGFVRSGVDELASLARDLPGISRRGCRQYVEERFSIARMTEDYIDVYRQLSGNARRTAGHRRNFLHSV